MNYPIPLPRKYEAEPVAICGYLMLLGLDEGTALKITRLWHDLQSAPRVPIVPDPRLYDAAVQLWDVTPELAQWVMNVCAFPDNPPSLNRTLLERTTLH